jgi:RNA polymerase sigma-70 factor (ECF subfamily)
MAQRARGRRERRVAAVEDPAVYDRGAAPRAGETIDLENALAQLPAGAREVFVLHDVQGYGHAEVGRMLGIAEGTSKAQLFRARRLLREMLER